MSCSNYYQDAYLSSLRKNSKLLDSPPPRALVRKEYGNGYTTSSSGRTKKKADVGGSVGGGEEGEEYTSPLLQRSRARMMERELFLKEYEGMIKATTTSNKNSNSIGTSSAKKADKNKKADDESIVIRGTTPRTKKLWDLDSPVSEDYTSTLFDQRDDGDDLSTNFDLNYGNSNTNNERDTSSELWNAAQIRRELRKDITKQSRKELSEMEEFTKEMRRRIQHYSPLLKKEDGTRVVLDESGDSRKKSNDVGGSTTGKGGSLYYSGEDNNYDDMGIELRLTKTESDVKDEDVNFLAREVTARTTNISFELDGYNKQIGVRSSGHNSKSDTNPYRKKDASEKYETSDSIKDIDNLIHKFQNARIRHSPRPGGDELMNSNPNSNSSGRKVDKSYHGIHEDDDEGNSSSRGSEEYISTSSSSDDGKKKCNITNGSPGNSRSARLQRIRDSKGHQPQNNHQKQKQLRTDQSERESEEPPSLSSKADTSNEVVKAVKRDLEGYKLYRQDLDSWWKEHKQQEKQEHQQHEDDKLEIWWKNQQGKRERMRKGNVIKPFEELAGEPTIHDDDEVEEEEEGDGSLKLRRKNKKNVVPSLPSVKPPLSPRRTSTQGGKTAMGTTTSSSSNLASYRSRHTKRCDALNNKISTQKSMNTNDDGGTRRSINLSPRRSPRAAAGPPCPEGNSPTSHGSKNGLSEEKSGRGSRRSWNDKSTPPRGSRDHNATSYNGSSGRKKYEENHTSPPPPLSVVKQPRHQEVNSTALSSASMLSELELEEDEDEEEQSNMTNGSNRSCQSVAQSTLDILLSRIDEAKSNFTRALKEGDVETQAELAGLISRLGEAAVTMKKLEQV